MKYRFEDKEFGTIIITVRQGMRNFVAKWKADTLMLSLPPGITTDRLREALDRMRPQLRQMRQRQTSPTYHFGQVIECFRCRVEIAPQSKNPKNLYAGRKDDGTLLLKVPAEWDLNDIPKAKNISMGLQWRVGMVAEQILLPFAGEVARELGVVVNSFSVGRGLRELGHCTGNNDIQLSRNLMFFDEPLVRFVVCHELAHITHKNHSRAFHDLVNRYTNGQEAALIARMKAFNWPIYR